MKPKFSGTCRFLKHSSFVILCVLSLNFINVSGQRLEDVVYLKNGNIIRGIILGDPGSDTIRILNHSGDTWVFRQNEIEKLVKEKPFEYKTKLFNQPGWEVNLNGILLLRSRSSAIGNAVIPGINMGLGYRINNYLSVQADMGFEFYEWLEVPLAASVRIRSGNRALSPLLILRGGYTTPAEKRKDDWSYRYIGKGGYHFSLGGGLERVLNPDASFLITFTYQYQELNYDLLPLNQWVQERTRLEAYSRLKISLGYVFK
jgi:hypothetical protein